MVHDAIGGSEVATLVIARRVLTLAVTPVPWSYDGTTEVDLDLELTGAVDGDDVSVVDGALAAALRDPGAGEDRVVDLTAVPVVLEGADAANYSVTVPTSATVDISRAGQRLEFRTTAPSPFVVGRTYSPIVVSDAGLSPSLSVVSDPSDGTGSVCVLVDGVLTAIEAGSCAIVASQPGNDDVAPALSAGQFVQVTAVAVANPDPEPDLDPTPNPTTSEPSSPSVSVPRYQPGLADAPLPGDVDPLITVGDSSGGVGAGEEGDAGGTSSPEAAELQSSDEGPSGATSDHRSTAGSRERPLGEAVAEETPESASDDGPVTGLISALGDNPGASLALLMLLAGAGWFLSRGNRWAALRRRGDDEEA